MNWKTCWKWTMWLILVAAVLYLVRVARAVTSPPIASAPPVFSLAVPDGSYFLTWSLSPKIQSYDTFDYLYLEGHYSASRPMFDLSGMLIASSSGGALPVHATCFKATNGGAYCTLYCPDRNRLFGLSAGGRMTMTDSDQSRTYISDGNLAASGSL